MGEYASDITFNGTYLKITSITPVRKQKTRKVILGKSLAQANIIGLNAQQWELMINGVVVGTTSANLSTNRAAIEALDDVTPHAFVDGIHNGTYILTPESLNFKDEGEQVRGHYTYSFKLVEE